MAQNNRNQNQREELKYEDMVEILKGNLDTFESFYYASLMRSEDHGKAGKRDSIFGALWGLRNKVGLEGILKALETQAVQSLDDEDGSSSQYNLATVVSTNAKTYFESAALLKIQDLLPYIKDRLGDAEIIEDYKDKQLNDLIDRRASKKEQAYGQYVMSQLGTAVMAKMTPLVYQEKAKRANKEYEAVVSMINQAEAGRGQRGRAGRGQRDRVRRPAA